MGKYTQAETKYEELTMLFLNADLKAMIHCIIFGLNCLVLLTVIMN